jgi:hypothetical protein
MYIQTTPHRSQILNNFFLRVLRISVILYPIIFLSHRRIYGHYIYYSTLLSTILSGSATHLGNKCAGILKEPDMWRRASEDRDWWRRMDCEGDRLGMWVRERVGIEGLTVVDLPDFLLHVGREVPRVVREMGWKSMRAMGQPFVVGYGRFISLLHGEYIFSDFTGLLLQIPAAIRQSVGAVWYSIVTIAKRDWLLDQIPAGLRGLKEQTAARVFGSAEIKKHVSDLANSSGFWPGRKIRELCMSVWSYLPAPIVGILITLVVTSVLVALMLGLTYLVSVFNQFSEKLN